LQEVSRKPDESFENLLRRFNKRVQQSGVLPLVKRRQYFERPLSKREARQIAIRKRSRKDARARMNH
jgi:small subunit ribosomal protein S21